MGTFDTFRAPVHSYKWLANKDVCLKHKVPWYPFVHCLECNNPECGCDRPMTTAFKGLSRQKQIIQSEALCPSV